VRKLDDYPIDELKRVYNLLQGRLREEPELMDSELLEDLQRLLQSRAREEGVDVSLHAQWATWLNGGAVLQGVESGD
jgi:hypothetical protein